MSLSLKDTDVLSNWSTVLYLERGQSLITGLTWLVMSCECCSCSSNAKVLFRSQKWRCSGALRNLWWRLLTFTRLCQKKASVCYESANTSLPAVSIPGEKLFQKIKWFFDKLIVHKFLLSLHARRTHCHWQVTHAVERQTGSEAIRTNETSTVWLENLWVVWIFIRIYLEFHSAHQNSHAAGELNSPDELTSARIILTLEKDLMWKGYCVFMDNWYSSSCLFREWRMKQTDAVGTETHVNGLEK